MRELTETFFSAELDEIERVLQAGQSGKYRGQELAAEVKLHKLKLLGHLAKDFGAADEETGALHILLVAIRALAAARAVRINKAQQRPEEDYLK